MMTRLFGLAALCNACTSRPQPDGTSPVRTRAAADPLQADGDGARARPDGACPRVQVASGATSLRLRRLRQVADDAAICKTITTPTRPTNGH
jgi:hypothetical protein